MINIQPILPAARPSPASALASSWSPGQLLLARVADIQADSTLVTLQIGRQLLSAQIKGSLSPGQILALQVISNGPIPVLKTAGYPQLVETLLRKIAPSSQPGTVTPFNALRNLPAGIQSVLPEGIREQLAAVIQHLPSLSELRQPQRLRRWLKQSGLFLEARLRRSRQQRLELSPGMDLKADLLRLRYLIDQALPTGTNDDTALLQALDQHLLLIQKDHRDTGMTQLASLFMKRLPARQFSALTDWLSGKQIQTLPSWLLSSILPRLTRSLKKSERQRLSTFLHQQQALASLHQHSQQALQQIETLQIHSLNRDNGDAQQLCLALPADCPKQSLQLQIERQDAVPEKDENESWRIRLFFDLAGTGPLEVQINIDHRSSVQGHFSAGQADTLLAISQTLEQLQTRLRNTGMEVRHISAHPAPQRHKASSIAPLRHSPYLDQRA